MSIHWLLVYFKVLLSLLISLYEFFFSWVLCYLQNNGFEEFEPLFVPLYSYQYPHVKHDEEEKKKRKTKLSFIFAEQIKEILSCKYSFLIALQ